MLVPAYDATNGRGPASLVKMSFSYTQMLALRLHLSPCNSYDQKNLCMLLLTETIAKPTLLSQRSVKEGAGRGNVHRRDEKRENPKRWCKRREAGICEVQQQSPWDQSGSV